MYVKIKEIPSYQENNTGVKAGDIVKVFIQEYVNNDPNEQYFLVETKKTVGDVYVSDEEVEQGGVVRLYQDPSLGTYRTGPYLWLEGEYVEIAPLNNRSAKHLLKAYEWRV